MTPTLVTVREYARLTTANVAVSLDQARISPSAFDWLCDLAGRYRASGAQLLQVENQRALRWDNFVGVVETPCGLRLEILPKHVEEDSEATKQSARAVLRRMLTTALDLPSREAEDAHLQRFDLPLLEWVIQRFLDRFSHLLQRGFRSDYVRVEEDAGFLRGQLDMAKQMRTPPGRAHRFNIRHDIFSPDRPENRLLKSALARIRTLTQHPDHWRLAHEHLQWMAEVPESQDIPADFHRWRDNRLMAHYQAVRPWCQLVLGHDMPLALAGDTRGVSLLFPMEKLFERSVCAAIRRSLPTGWTLTEQASRHSLCLHGGNDMFRLKPDMLLTAPDQRRMVMDAKWKLIDAARRERNYDLNQNDFYQLFAYGHKYLPGSGRMALIFPASPRFHQPLTFEFAPGLQLQALPFDLESGRLALPQGCDLFAAQ